ncbi:MULTISPECIES: pyrroline-5-carboxylate reductase [unclassified Paenibacillus]|uniref:pyrroline-5-carboxylate reductase n=1 Tax=unclassified Paenibacillus TaxID=185978 RepID=UPI001AE6D9AD|nr:MULTISPECIES: pyrroline-5-carboxylate reductase [unclassified Paenibacillus]MBP1156239.1 pyrroline-5-carboxylate reductase [Paenibacillus sp. PvP091]MBP1168375.1 pyrroline-5-carboxylate reductase [Paenibacillus sp. PvR098]MBP2439403.1 pyrroline-5-carboxylate reductase [Paenibacillus sp. PvP052]
MTQSLSHMKITFVGAGSMAEAIIRGLITKGGVHGENIFVMNRTNHARLEELRERYGVRYSVIESEKEDAIRSGHIVVLAFKPKDAAEGLIGIKHLLSAEQLLISVIAGLTTDTMKELLGGADYSIVRTMPNTSSTIGLGATGISFSSHVSPEGRQIAIQMFESTGVVSVVEEPLLDTITGVSGSGPAYIYYMMEAMIQGGIQGGLAPEEARRLTVQTVLGAASMVEATGENPSDLRLKVTSPNGTTQAALETLDSHGFPEAVTKAVLRAAERAGEMGAAISASVTSQTK